MRMPESDDTLDDTLRDSDDALDAMVGGYLDRLNAGEMLDLEEIRREHPESAAEVLERLEVFQGFDAGFPVGAESLGTIGDYTLQRQIGRGGMGVVYEAWEGSMDRAVALKVLPAGIAADDRALHRFVREARTAGKLSHPNIVSIYGMGLKEETPYYAMELVDGATLAQILSRTRGAVAEADTPFGKKDDIAYFAHLARAFAEVADGLQHAHSRGIVHRDIKPSNLIFDPGADRDTDEAESGAREPRGRLRILDFGLAHREGQESLTLSGDFVGTPLYMSPEQARRRKIPVDHRTDIYSLGATLYETLCGRPPFRGKDHADTLSKIIERDPPEPRRLNARIPVELQTIVLKCLRKEPGDRYGTAEALEQDLRRFVRGDPIEARAQSGWDRVSRRLRRHRIRLTVSAIVLLLLVASAWLALARATSERERLHLEREQKLAAYRPAVREAAMQIATGRYSLESGSYALSGAGLGVPSPLTREDLRDALERGGRNPLREAIAALEEQTAELPDERDAHYYLARAHRVLGERRPAEEEARRALEIDPRFVPAAYLLRKLGVEIELDAAIAGDDRTWQRAWIESRHAESPEARARACDRLIDGANEPYIGFPFEQYLLRGTVRLALGDHDRARQDFAVSRHMAPSALEPQLLLGKAYLLEEKGTRAHEIFEALHDRHERPAEAALWIGVLCYLLGEFAEAKEWMKRVEPEGLRERLTAQVCLALEDWDEAEWAARRAMVAEPGSVQGPLLLASAMLGQISRGGAAGADCAIGLAAACREALALDDDPRGARFLVGLARETLEIHGEAFSADDLARARRALDEAARAAGIAPENLASGAAPVIFDDFSDGDAFDGRPVEWIGARGRFTPAPEGLECLAEDTSFVGILGTRDVLSGGVLVRVRGSFNGTERPPRPDAPWPRLVAACHWDYSAPGGPRGYNAGVGIDGRLWIARWTRDRLEFLARGCLELGEAGECIDSRLDESWLEIELSALAATDDRGRRLEIELRVWRLDDEAQDGGRPATAQLSAVDRRPHLIGQAGAKFFTVGDRPVLIRSLSIQKRAPPHPGAH